MQLFRAKDVGVEIGKRQRFDNTAFGVRKVNGDAVGIIDELQQVLTAQTAGHAGDVRVADYQQLAHVLAARDNHVRDRRRLCAPARGVGGVFDVAARMDAGYGSCHHRFYPSNA